MANQTVIIQDDIKFSLRIQPEPTDGELEFARQLGVAYVYTAVGAEQANYAFLASLRSKVEDAGLSLWNVMDSAVAKSDKIHLALPGRDETIERFCEFIRDLGRAGIHTTTFTWESSGVWRSERGTTRGASAAQVDLAELLRRPVTHGRTYSCDEIWENFAYFMDRILPVAEAAGVRLSLHPNDPPVPALGGIPCLIHSFEDYKRAFAIAKDSPNLGMEFCVGCWLEGGAAFGDLFEAIRYFRERRKIFIVHFRNVSATLPNFVETFLDNGYMDMYRVMKAFCDVGYDGTMTLDHTPLFAEGYAQGAASAYAIGYMRALLERARAETRFEM